MAKTVAQIALLLIGGYVLSITSWIIVSALWEEYGNAIKARWPRWVVVVFPLLFTVYIVALKAVTLRQMRRAADEYDATYQGRTGRTSVWPRPRGATGRASVPANRVMDGEWVERR